MLVFYWLPNARILLNEQEVFVLQSKDYAYTLIMSAKQAMFVSKWYGLFFFFLVEPRELLDLRLPASADNTNSSWRDCVIGAYVV